MSNGGIQQFQDEWVENQTLFRLFTQSGCSCCNLSMNIDMSRYIAACTDLSDAAGVEEEDDNKSPWPQYLREEVWADRVKLRNIMKKKKLHFADKIDELGGIEKVSDLWKAMPLDMKRRCFQFPLSELHLKLQEEFQFSKAYLLVLYGVLEQVQSFEKTGYASDSYSPSEQRLEQCFTFCKSTFTVSDIYFDDHNNGESNEEREKKCFGFLSRLEELISSPSLLPKREKKKEEEEEEGTGAAATVAGSSGGADTEKKGSRRSFRSDRRLLRTLIFFYFLENVMFQWNKQHNQTNP